MPAIIPIVGRLIGDVLQYFKDKNTAATLKALWGLIENVALKLGQVADALIWSGQQERGAWQYIQDGAKAGSDGLAQVAIDQRAMWLRLLDVILPNTVSWTLGYVVSHWIDPLRRDIAGIGHSIKFLMGWRGQIDYWRKHTVDPEIKRDRGVISWLLTWPRDVLDTWHTWFAHPDQFGTWAAAPVLGPIIAYLADPKHTGTRDNLAAIMVSAWAEEPAKIEALIVDWLLT